MCAGERDGDLHILSFGVDPAPDTLKSQILHLIRPYLVRRVSAEGDSPVLHDDKPVIIAVDEDGGSIGCVVKHLHLGFQNPVSASQMLQMRDSDVGEDAVGGAYHPA